MDQVNQLRKITHEKGSTYIMKTKLICPFNKMATKKFGISEDNWGYLKIALTKWIDCVMTGFYIYINKLIAVDVGNSNMAKADKK